MLGFELSMPGVGSWDGKWSGRKNYYAICRRKPKGANLRKYYRYDFGDGWVAGVSVREVDSREAQKIRRKSCGFCGYDWMITSILTDGRIITPTARKQEASNDT